MAVQVWAVNALGGFAATSTLSRKVYRAAQQEVALDQFSLPVLDYGKKKGDTVLYDRRLNVDDAGGTLSETNKMIETNTTFAQGSVVVGELGNSIRYSGKLETLATIGVVDELEEALKDDMVKTLDLQVRTVVRSTDIKIKYSMTGTAASPTSNFDTDGTQTTVFARHAQTFDIKEIADYLRGTLYAPHYEDKSYVCVCSVGFHRAIFDSAEFQDAAIRNQGAQRIWNGEVMNFYGVRFVIETNSFSNTMTAFRGEAVIFGKEPWVRAVALSPEIRVKLSEDYGRDKGIAWYAIQAHNEVWDTATASQAKVVHITG